MLCIPKRYYYLFVIFLCVSNVFILTDIKEVVIVVHHADSHMKVVAAAAVVTEEEVNQ